MIFLTSFDLPSYSLIPDPEENVAPLFRHRPSSTLEIPEDPFIRESYLYPN